MTRPVKSLVFACNLNAIRSPMAEALARRRFGADVSVASCGVWEGGALDPFMVAALDEMGLDMSAHEPKLFEDLDLDAADVIVTLTEASDERARALVGEGEPLIVHWPTYDPTGEAVSREQRMDAYRTLARDLDAKLKGLMGEIDALDVARAQG